METFSPARTRPGAAPAVTDNAILRRSLSDPAAFGEIFDRHFVRIHGYLARRAGSQAAERVARGGGSWRLTGYVGPKAFEALTAAGIKIGQNLEGMTVREAVARFRSGAFEAADNSNREAGK